MFYGKNTTDVEKLLAAIDKLIVKYSSKEYRASSLYACPLCRLFYKFEYDVHCLGCPNQIFELGHVGCVGRGIQYPALDYTVFSNYDNLIQFWIIVKELIVSGEDMDSAMLKAAIQFPLPDEDAI